MTWTDERIAALRDLHGQRKSFSNIAAALGGVSRNAVIGKAHRLGLFSPVMKPKPAHNPRGARGKRVDAPAPKRLRINTGGGRAFRGEVEFVVDNLCELAPDTSDFACTIATLGSDMCRYVLGEPTADALYCGAPTRRGPWCVRHHAIVWQPKAARR